MAAGDCVKGFVIGGLIGAALGILYAPKSGVETREDIAKGYNGLKDRTKQHIDEACTKMDELAGRGKELISEGKQRIGKALEFCASDGKEGKPRPPKNRLCLP